MALVSILTVLPQAEHMQFNGGVVTMVNKEQTTFLDALKHCRNLAVRLLFVAEQLARK